MKTVVLIITLEFSLCPLGSQASGDRHRQGVYLEAVGGDSLRLSVLFANDISRPRETMHHVEGGY